MIAYHHTRHLTDDRWTASVTVDGYRIEGGMAPTQAAALERLRVACGRDVADTERAARKAAACMAALPVVGVMVEP